jgi:hypothetical protein
MHAVELEGARQAAAVAWLAYARLEHALVVIEAGLPDAAQASAVARNALNAALVADPRNSLTEGVDG